MRAIERKNISRPSSQRTAFLLGLILLLACAFGCGSPSSQGPAASSPSSDSLELTDAMIHERINEVGVRNIPDEGGTGEPIYWNFDEDEPKEITIVEKQIEGNRATIVLDIKTTSSPRSRTQRYLAGQIRTEWKLRTGWVLRRWEVDDTENISMKYRTLPKPATPTPTSTP